MIILACLAASLAGIGLLFTLAGCGAAWRFARRRDKPPAARPPVTILKPLHGDEPLLEAALASLCQLDYPAFQVVLGVQDPADPAIAVARRLQARFPERDIELVVDPTGHGPNRKVGNLINMLRAARHDVLVIADSDVHVAPGYLDQLVATLAQPGIGLATTLYTGLPANRSLAARLGAMQISHTLLPGVLIARVLGRRDCLGATMALRRETLAQIGGLRAMVGHLADDNVLGRLVRETGLGVGLANAVPATTVPETTFRALWKHELRWARTIRALEPVGFILSALQYPLFWAELAVVLSAGAPLFLAMLALTWAVRGVATHGIDRALGLAIRTPLWLLPLRDPLFMAVMVVSFLGGRVEWRGHPLHADNGRDEAYAPDEGIKSDENPVPASPVI